jgi:hypothetical protein
VSAYEYEFLKVENEVRERTVGCTIYFIIQRPLTYFNNVKTGSGFLEFDIVDGTQSPLRCFFPLVESGILEQGEQAQIELGFYKKEPDRLEPYNDVAAIKIFRASGDFVVWYSPQKFLYEVIVNGLPGQFKGDPFGFLDFTVHYIGKAFSQPIWERLTGHDKMQKILTMENSLSDKSTRAPFEISLLQLDVIGFDDHNVIGSFDFTVPNGVEPIIHAFGDSDDDKRFEEYWAPHLKSDSPELTAEVEALLINLFKPSYNEVLFENYPNIIRGTRSAGYTHATLTIKQLPASLRTKHHAQKPIR